MHALLIGGAIALGIYLLGLLVLLLMGRRDDATALARFVPDCAVLFSRLLRDPAIRRSRKVLLVLLIAYLSSPIDLVPDFLPVIGLLDDAILVALVLRFILRDCEASTLEKHWPGPPGSLRVVLRLAGSGPPIP